MRRQKDRIRQLEKRMKKKGSDIELTALKKEYRELLHQILAPLSVDERIDLALGRISIDDSRLNRLCELREKILELDPSWQKTIKERVKQLSEEQMITIMRGSNSALRSRKSE